MERRTEDGDRELQRPNQPPPEGLSQRSSWSQALRAGPPWRGWYSVAVVGVVWSVCQAEAPLHPSLGLVEACRRLLLVCILWAGLGSSVLALRYYLRLKHKTGAPPQKMRQDVLAEHSDNQYSRISRDRRPDQHISLAHTLTDSLLLCVLHEPMRDPSLPHIQALRSRLESVSHTLDKVDMLSEAPPEGANQRDGESTLIDKVKRISSYLQQRTRSLRRLLRVQGELEARVKDMLEGLELLWTQLEELHTRVTLTKDWSEGHRDLSTVKTEAEDLSTVLGQYKSRLQRCQAYQGDSTQLLQELTWSHTHISHSVSSSESVWTELLLQSNIEQFDKVQESFLSLEQQTSTFQAHLEGLGGGIQEGHAGPLSGTERAPCSCSVSSQSLPCPCEGHTTDVTPDEDAPPPTLCERSTLQFSTAIGRLRRSGRQK